MKRCGIKATLRGLHPVEKSLMLFLFILLAQSAYTMLFHRDWGQGASDIDVIVRTASAAIFGHFLSSNFMRTRSAGGQAQTTTAVHKMESVGSLTEDAFRLKGQIGFSDAPAEPETGKIQKTDETVEQQPACLQVVVATGIGLFCLLTLLLLRNTTWGKAVFLSESDSVTAAVAQFRDFVSGCVGFLIGCPAEQSDQSL